MAARDPPAPKNGYRSARHAMTGGKSVDSAAAITLLVYLGSGINVSGFKVGIMLFRRSRNRFA